MELPARIGKYELQEFLGGGMSHVYRAQDTVIGRTVAVKILTDAGCQDEEAKARFLAEARMAGNLTHDNVLGIYDFGEDANGHPFMVMEFLRGEDLRHAIRDGHTGDVSGKLNIALQVARALQFIHSQHIIHRDIKPENIHITNNGVVKLMDFGIAKTEGLSMTRAGYVLGTPYYMAPEQVTGQNVTEQVDVYSFGVLLFEIFTGTKPIAGDTVERIFYSILNEPLNLEPLARAGAPEAIRLLVGHCTAKSPAERPQGFGPVCEELERIAAERTAPTLQIVARNEKPPKASKLAWLLPIVGGLAVLLAVGVYFGARPKAPAGPVFARSISTPTGEMELVPAGPFLYGQNKETANLPAYYVDKTEVTNAAYAAFCKASGHELPPEFPADRPDYAVVNVSILDAQAFAKWAGKRLPNAREWEKAARGEKGLGFPWGDDLDPTRAAIGLGAPVTANAFPKGASPYGALQMIGNVWELVGELSPPSPQALANFGNRLKPPPGKDEPWYTIRGGGYDVPQLSPDLTWDSTTVPARWKNPNIGFRCVKDAQ
jgi:eukaryotic-like serine/threonine-protein kinase